MSEIGKYSFFKTMNLYIFLCKFIKLNTKLFFIFSAFARIDCFDILVTIFVVQRLWWLCFFSILNFDGHMMDLWHSKEIFIQMIYNSKVHHWHMLLFNQDIEMFMNSFLGHLRHSGDLLQWVSICHCASSLVHLLLKKFTQSD